MDDDDDDDDLNIHTGSPGVAHPNRFVLTVV
jgi:hypothetical protein